MVYNLGVVGEAGMQISTTCCSSVPSARRFSHHSIGKHLFVQESEACRNHSVHLPCFLQVYGM